MQYFINFFHGIFLTSLLYCWFPFQDMSSEWNSHSVTHKQPFLHLISRVVVLCCLCIDDVNNFFLLLTKPGSCCFFFFYTHNTKSMYLALTFYTINTLYNGQTHCPSNCYLISPSELLSSVLYIVINSLQRDIAIYRHCTFL